MFIWKNKTPIAQNAIFLELETTEGRPFKSRFLEAGLVKYDFGVCLLKKDTINKFIESFIGKPVIIDHKDDIKDSDIVGEILKVWFNSDDGWFWCEGVLTDKEAIDLIENQGYNVSCQYAITDYSVNSENKLHNGNSYDKEILDGDFEHLAIVNNPRYEGAYIAVNAYVAKNAICRNLTATNDKWITVHPNGKDGKGRHLQVKDGETVKEAIARIYKETPEKKEQRQKRKEAWDILSKVTGMDKRYLYRNYKRDNEKILEKIDMIQDKLEVEGADDSVYKHYSGFKNDRYRAERAYSDLINDTSISDPQSYEDDYGSYLEQEYNKNYSSLIDEYNKSQDFDTMYDNYSKLLGREASEEDILNFIDDAEQRQNTNSAKDETNQRKAKVQTNWKNKSQAELRDAIKTLEKKISRGAIQDDLLESSMQTVEYMRELLEKPLKSYNPLKDGKTLAQQADEFYEKNPDYDPHQEFIKRQKNYKPWKYAKNSFQQQYQKIIDYITNYKGATMTLEERLFKGLFSALKARNEAEEEKETKKEKEDKKAENEDTDKRKLIDEVAGIMKSAGADDEEIRTAIAKMEKIAYDKSEAGTADNKAKNEDGDKKDDKVDKRDLIRQIAAIAGKEEDSEDVRTIIKLAEKIAYEKSEAGTADNCKGKNKAKNDEEEEYKQFIDDVEKEASDPKAKNALKEATDALYSALAPEKKMYISQKEGLELGKKIYG